jgi:hypothetical protein
MINSNDESKCHFVSSHGLIKSMIQHPKTITTNLGRHILYNFNFDNNYKETIYIRTDDIPSFFKYNLDNFKNPIILISGDMDTTIPDDIENFMDYYNNPKIILWYAQNLNLEQNYSKLRHLPIGLDYHTLGSCNFKHLWGYKISPLDQDKELFTLRNKIKNIKDVIPDKAVANFHLSTFFGPIRRQNYREPIFNILQHKTCVIWLDRQIRLEFWKSCEICAFVICPFGNGLDTHRTWETLCLGRIPIIGKSNLNTLFQDLPFVEVEDWNQLSEEFLEEKYKNIIEKWDKYNWNKLTLEYWVNKIKNES